MAVQSICQSFAEAELNGLSTFTRNHLLNDIMKRKQVTGRMSLEYFLFHSYTLLTKNKYLPINSRLRLFAFYRTLDFSPPQWMQPCFGIPCRVVLGGRSEESHPRNNSDLPTSKEGETKSRVSETDARCLHTTHMRWASTSLSPLNQKMWTHLCLHSQ